MDRQTVKSILTGRRDQLATAVLERHFSLDPSLEARYDDYRKARCLEDVRYHLTFLAEAISLDLPAIFVDYLLWAKTVLVSRSVDIGELDYNLKVMSDALVEQLEGDLRNEIAQVIEVGRQAVSAHRPVAGAELSSHDLTRRYTEFLVKGDRRGARELILSAVDSGTSVADIYLQVLQPSQWEIGSLWHENKISVAHEHFATAATQSIMAELYPYFAATPRRSCRMVAAAAPGEIHELGIRMVADFFELDGWDTYFLGANTPLRDLMRMLGEQRPHVLALSASTALNLSAVQDIIAATRQLADPPKIMVGGRLFLYNPELWQRVGADGFAPDARSAVARGNELVGQTT